MKVLNKIITAEESNESYNLICWIRSHNLSEEYKATNESFFKERIIERYKAHRYPMNFEGKNVVLIVTGRTIKEAMGQMNWSKFNPYENINYIQPTIVQVPKIQDGQENLNKFYNEYYFTPLYTIDNKIYIFGVNPEPGKPFKIEKGDSK
jgi:hypothetical protein